MCPYTEKLLISIFFFKIVEYLLLHYETILQIANGTIIQRSFMHFFKKTNIREHYKSLWSSYSSSSF